MAASQWLIGIAMKAYRRSPLYPRWGFRLAKVLSRVTRTRRTVVKTINGVTFALDLTDTIGASLYYSGTFEAATEKAIETRVRAGMIALDIGANFGYHTFRLAKSVGDAGRVIAIEPMSEAFSRLEQNAALNDYRQITYVRAALSDRDQGLSTVAFTSHYDLVGPKKVDAERVDITTVDGLVGKLDLSRVDFIKMDVDGFEGKVFRGAESTLTRWKPTVLFEVSPDAMHQQGDSASELLRFLDTLGYGLLHENGTPLSNVEELMQRTDKWSVNLLATPAGSQVEASS